MVLKCIKEFTVEVDNGEYLEDKVIEVGTIVTVGELEIVNTVEIDELDLTLLLSFDELFANFDIIVM